MFVLQAAAAPVTFNQQIAPIVYKNCSPCHRPGEAAPFPLLSYDDAKQHAAQIAAVTKRRYMPPWLPEPGHGEFAEERRLSDAEIQLIQEWVEARALPGTPRGAPQPPKFTDEWQLGHARPDPARFAAVSAQRRWRRRSSGISFCRCRSRPRGGSRPSKCGRATARVFHHANVIIDRSRSSRRQERVPGAGFPGMDLNVEEETFDPDGHFLSWKPGSEPVVEPDGMAWRADPGMDLVLNVHLRPNGKPETVSPMIGLLLHRAAAEEVPDAGAARARSRDRHSAGGAKDFLVTDDVRLPLDVDVLAVYPHAHYLGKLMEGYATLPDGTKKWLIRIPEWDLNWQGVYRLKSRCGCRKGTVVSMRYHYDNSAENVRNPSSSAARGRRAATRPPMRWAISGSRYCRPAGATGARRCRKGSCGSGSRSTPTISGPTTIWATCC